MEELTNLSHTPNSNTRELLGTTLIYATRARKVQDHLDKCPLEMAKCESSHVGYQEKLHCYDNLSDKAGRYNALTSKMINESLQKILEEKDRQLLEKDAQLVKKDNELKETIQQKDRQLQEKDRQLEKKDRQLHQKDRQLHQKDRQLEEKDRQLEKKDRQLHQKDRQLEEKDRQLEKKYRQLRLSVTMEDFSHKYKYKHQWFSPPYFTQGYKMCFEVDFKNNRTSLGIYSYMMSGPHDDDLEWPFKGRVIVRLLNQLGDHHHYDCVFDYEDMTEGGRVIEDKRGDYLSTQSKHLPLDKLNYKCRTNCQYLKDDCLKFKVILPP